MIQFKNKEIWSLVISVLVVSVAFTVQELTVSFFLQCLAIVAFSYFLHHIMQEISSESHGIHTTHDLFPIGIVAALASGILSGGLAVIAIPSVMKIREVEVKRWMLHATRATSRDVGIPPATGVIFNLFLATVFVVLFSVFGLQVFWLGALVNFWITLANMVPYPPMDGSRVNLWSSGVWFLTVVAAIIGLFGLLV